MSMAAADMDTTTGIELVTASDSTLSLWEWDTTQFTLLDSVSFSYRPPSEPYALACADLGGDTCLETVLFSGWRDNDDPPDSAFNAVAIYDWSSQQTLTNITWLLDPEAPIDATPCAGRLADTLLVGLPQQEYDVTDSTSAPALLVTPTGSVNQCERSDTSSNNLKYGMFADWDPFTVGADAFVLPSETQCLAWLNDGRAIEEWPVTFEDIDVGAPVCPAALGNLDGAGYADVITGTVLDGNWQALAYNSGGYELQSLGFPFMLPDGLNGLGGFAIADIDRDGSVEVVFGSSDGYLHCWELGSCSTGYSPWPQFQHDSGRSGVLE
jgi:hypothetical protein